MCSDKCSNKFELLLMPFFLNLQTISNDMEAKRNMYLNSAYFLILVSHKPLKAGMCNVE
jgi:hypothetical protein